MKTFTYHRTLWQHLRALPCDDGHNGSQMSTKRTKAEGGSRSWMPLFVLGTSTCAGALSTGRSIVGRAPMMHSGLHAVKRLSPRAGRACGINSNVISARRLANGCTGDRTEMIVRQSVELDRCCDETSRRSPCTAFTPGKWYRREKKKIEKKTVPYRLAVCAPIELDWVPRRDTNEIAFINDVPLATVSLTAIINDASNERGWFICIRAIRIN